MIDVIALVERELGEEVEQVTPLTGMVGNASSLVRTPGRQLVLKACREQDWRCETTALTRLRGAGVPVASLLAAGHEDDQAWLIIDFVDGDRCDDDAVRAEAGAALREVHGLIMDAYGRPGRTFSTWREVLLDRLDDDLTDTLAAGLLMGEEAERARELIMDAPAYDGPPVLLHGDLKDLHLHSQDGRLVALLDWGDAQGGDPLYDLARYSLEGPAQLHALLAGYGPIALDEARLRAYRLRFTLDCLATELRAGGDWFAVYQQRIAADL